MKQTLGAALVGAAILAYALLRAGVLSLANHDVAWFLHAGEIWLDGGTIGVDVVDTNPPLVIWISGLEVALARTVALTPLAIHAVVTCALLFSSLLLGASGLRFAGVGELAASLFLPLAAAASAFASQYEFGQREHWISLLLLAYVAWSFVDPPRGGTAGRLAAGSLAGLGVARKPHYALAIAAVELLRAVRLRTWRSPVRTETLAIGAVALAYGVSVLSLVPSYLDELRETLLVYRAYDNPIPLWSSHTGWTLAALAAVAVARARGLRHPVADALALVAASCWIAAFLQRKNFDYHHVPTDWFAQVAIALLVSMRAADAVRKRPAWEPWARAGAAVVAAAWVATLWIRPPGMGGREEQRMILERFAAGEPVMLLSTGVHRVFPAVTFSSARFVSPFSCLWQIPGSYPPAARTAQPFAYRRWEDMTPLEQRTVSRLLEAWAGERPRLVGFDHAIPMQGFGDTDFRFPVYLSAHPGFAALMAPYERVAVAGGFEYYRRRGP